ncbi:hypothetical protein LMH73_010610 [Vibrio splendidus]|nr:hypothetical protein [Vibrio splendidus]MCC4880398.1 hypothetical protein [Vibrio splendidus]
MKKYILMAALVAFSSLATANDLCYKPQEGQSKENIAQSKKAYEDNADAKKMLSTCGGPLLMGMSPKKIAETKCEDGSYPCPNAVKILCKKRYGEVVGKDSKDTPVCKIFGFLL